MAIRNNSIVGGRRDLTGLLVVLALFVMAGLVIFHSDQNGPQTVGVENSPDPSVENTRASGSRGLYLLTGELGYHNQIWRHSFLSLPDSATTLFCIAPEIETDPDDESGSGGGADSGDDGGNDDGDDDQPNALTGTEGEAVRNWVAGGHTLILFTSEITNPPQSDPGGSKSDDADAKTGAKTSVHTEKFGEELSLRVQTSLNDSEGNGRQRASRRFFAPLQPSTWTQGVDDIVIHPGDQQSSVRLACLPGVASQILFGDTYEVHPQHTVPASASYLPQPVALVYKIGKGHVIAVADDLFGCNANLPRDGNARFIADILRQTTSVGDTVLFDEYHHASGGEASPSVWTALGTPLQYGILQLTLAALVALLVLAPRLGRSEPLNRSTGHTTAEYVASLAGLYQSAGATNTALETIYRQFLREVCAKFGLPSDTALDQVAEVASRRGGVGLGELRRLLIDCEKALDTGSGSGSAGRKASNVSGQELITLTRAIERFRKELGIG